MLDAAALLLSVVAPIFTSRRVCILVDSWYMKRPYLELVKQHGFHAIGQVRRDTALNDLPQPRSGGGRPRKYGDLYTAERVGQLPEFRSRLYHY